MWHRSGLVAAAALALVACGSQQREVAPAMAQATPPAASQLPAGAARSNIRPDPKKKRRAGQNSAPPKAQSVFHISQLIDQPKYFGEKPRTSRKPLLGSQPLGPKLW